MTMNIVSMCTQDYKIWLYPFIKSIQKTNPRFHIIVYLLNFTPELIERCRRTYPEVEFRIYCGDFKSEDGKQLVTYLKPQFIKESLSDNVLWIDITSFINGDLSEIEKSINVSDHVRITRKGLKPNRLFCAEIIGFNKNSKEIHKYYQYVNEDPHYWYTDQLSLNRLSNSTDLEQGKYCNFTYDKCAITWSDRGRTPSGKSGFGDIIYVLDKYAEQLNKEDFIRHIDMIEERPRVIAFTDDDKWCFFNNATNMIKKLSYFYNFLLVYDVKLQRDDITEFNADFVWSRCSAFRTDKLLSLFPELRTKTICSFTTGGTGTQVKLDNHRKFSKDIYGIITQTEDVKKILNREFPHQRVFMIPNGVDIDIFKPIKRGTDFVVGFAARSEKSCDNQKGFTQFFLNPCKKLGVAHKYANFSDNFIPHEKMSEFFNSIDVLIQASEFEGCSNTIQEAMASGIPCIITKVGYHGEVCEDMKHLLFTKRDESEVIQKLRLLKENRELYKTISKYAREFALKHSYYDIAAKYKEVFDDLYKHL